MLPAIYSIRSKLMHHQLLSNHLLSSEICFTMKHLLGDSLKRFASNIRRRAYGAACESLCSTAELQRWCAARKRSVTELQSRRDCFERIVIMSLLERPKWRSNAGTQFPRCLKKASLASSSLLDSGECIRHFRSAFVGELHIVQ